MYYDYCLQVYEYGYIHTPTDHSDFGVWCKRKYQSAHTDEHACAYVTFSPLKFLYASQVSI